MNPREFFERLDEFRKRDHHVGDIVEVPCGDHAHLAEVKQVLDTPAGRIVALARVPEPTGRDQ